ncbi:MAG: ornithine carbamoyltransferase [Nitrospirae bacterium]|nr:ornithine carbamoyltransferase [Nitrospirota bacterium]
MTHAKPRHLLAIADLTADGMLGLLDLAAAIKADPRHPRYSQSMTGKTLGMVFDKPSTRTRISFEVAMNQLGGSALLMDRQQSQLGRGETVADTARTLSRFLDGIMMRTFGHGIITELASHATIPVINGLTDLAHPCQALADLLTVREKFGRLRGVAMAYVGDGNNVAHSLMQAAARAGMDMRVATPKGYGPDPGQVRLAHEAARAEGGRLTLGHDPDTAARGAQALYTDVWTSMGQEAEQAERRHAFAGFQINAELMAQAAPDAVFMHCLPAHRGEEVSAEVMDGPRSVVFDQAENRLHAQKAVLFRLLGGDAR